MDAVILGWDVGGVNTKVALVQDGNVRCVLTRAFELQRAPGDLVPLLRAMAAAAGGGQAMTHAVTMTAELSQMFRTKRDGVEFVLNAVTTAFPGADIHVYTVDGNFVAPAAAREQPLAVAAANWSATAHVVAQHHPDALLIDVGTTTTDLIPIVRGHVAATGRTDPERLAAAELVYTGAVRTPVEAIVRDVPLGGGRAAVSAEGFALAGDVHVWREQLAPSDYDAPTPDGRPPTREFAGERLARVVCGDTEMLEAAAIDGIACAVADAQVAQIASAIRRIRGRHPELTLAVVTGLGAFIGAVAARAAGLDVVPLSSRLGEDGARSAPATAVALLLAARQPEGRPLHTAPDVHTDIGGGDRQVGRNTGVTVIKLGGGLLATPEQWNAALAGIADGALSRRLVIVPGGGPFADAVRDVDATFGVTADAAHWMAIAGMDQHAEMIAAALGRGQVVYDAAGVVRALSTGMIPVLAPLQWLRAEDPLPHGWDVTSDSIAAWVAGALEASELVLIKPEGAAGPSAVDPFFPQALPPGLAWSIQPARELSLR